MLKKIEEIILEKIGTHLLPAKLLKIKSSGGFSEESSTESFIVLMKINNGTEYVVWRCSMDGNVSGGDYTRNYENAVRFYDKRT